jgi:two-component system, OmpR family, phosphate regulon sensor histidine kinase PhoR
LALSVSAKSVKTNSRYTVTITSDEIYQSLATYTADGLLVSDARGRIVDCNPALANMLGEAAQTFAGKKFTDVLECTCLEQARATEQNGDGLVLATSDANNVHNATLICKSGMDLTMPVSHMPLMKNGAVAGYVTVIYIVQANTVQQAQTEFVSTVSHELRTPLTSIKGFADTILRAGDRLDVSQQKRYIGIIKDQADRLTRLVEDLLAVSRLESRKLQLTIRAIDLDQAVQRVVRNLSDKAENHHIVSRIPPGLPPVWADADRLEQILTNLIDNAIKYSPAQTTVTISARSIDRHPEDASSHEMVEFSVNDQGGGIPQEHLPEIFQKFGRLDNPLVRQTEGTGLGLYITKSLVLALGGVITVDSEPGSTTFTVRLPAATLEEQAARGRGLL